MSREQSDSPDLKYSDSSSLSATDGQTNKQFPNIAFECSLEKLDANSLQALHHQDDEDQVHRTLSASTNSRKKQKESEKFLPGQKCAVCGDAAIGIHYSCYCCVGCKIFFRRVLMENRSYSCKGNGNCPIDINTRCSCRHCRFKKCLDVGMDCTELNIERRRKRKATEQTRPEVEIEAIDDPLIRDLMIKEKKFLKMLTSSLAPIHTNLAEALGTPQSTFDDFQRYEEKQLGSEDQLNFSYWRSKILSTVIEWAKSFPEFQQLSMHDKQSLIVHSSFSNLVLSEAFHTPQHYQDRIVFPDGLSGFRNLTANILKERSGLIPTVVAVINNILVPIRKMKMTEVEYVLLQAIIFFDPECLSLTDDAIQITQAKRLDLLRSLKNYLDKVYNESESAHRYAALLLRISNVHKVAAYKRETLCTIETFQLISPHPLTMEISKKYSEVSFF
ncbi:hypothetical protein M3Y94_00781400 [Aphelenchoides besseyi]|nr:hypothetical protein M3Y94_00781400 [Aphelenchoides besseyi]KAI6232356.1 hypothetical protein M3Y95_00477400 [Aphelenchoides besseyi]